MAFLLVHLHDGDSSKSLFYSLWVCTTVVVLRDFVVKIHWGLNKTAGISGLLTMHHAEGKALIRTLWNQRPVQTFEPLQRVRRENRVTRDAFSKRLTGFDCFHSHTRQPVNLQGCLLLFVTFSFKQRKSGTFSFTKGKNLIKSPVCVQRKHSFCHKIFWVEKSYVFLIRISAEILFLFRFCGIM